MVRSGGAGRKPRGAGGRRGGLGRGSNGKRRQIQINGLDLLHTQTLLSTSPQAKKLPPAPGCIDQKLTRISHSADQGSRVPCRHEEIPPSLAVVADDGANIPYGLQVLTVP